MAEPDALCDPIATTSLYAEEGSDRSTALTLEAAAADPDVTPQNAMSWFRSKLPSVSAETKEMLVHALGVLFLAALNAAAQNAISQQEAAAAAPATWWESLPTRAEVLDAKQSYPNLRGGTGAPCANESVVDAVFAKAERKTDGR